MIATALARREIRGMRSTVAARRRAQHGNALLAGLTDDRGQPGWAGRAGPLALCTVWYWVFKFAVIGPAAIAVLRPRWIGREHLPRTGPFVLAANHLSLIDPAFVGLGVPRKVIFIAKRKYYEGSGLKGRFTRWFLDAIGQSPIDPASAHTAAPALDASRRLLAGGGVWAVFPEGTRSPDGRLHRGRTGLMRVALPLGIPVIPVAVTGTTNPRRQFSRKPGTARVTVTYGPPLDLRPWAGRGDDPQAWREATDALMARLAQMTGQEYLDEYAVRPASERF
jgi:1-acyl-sn-glycerol-3-phosphate acyltransferase